MPDIKDRMDSGSGRIDRSTSKSDFESFVRQHHQRLFAHVRLTYPGVDADAIVNEAFTIAWRRFDEIQREAALAWLRSTARNLVLNDIRQRRRLMALRGRIDRLEPRRTGSDPADDGAGMQLSVVIDALNSLSPDDRELLVMAGLSDLDSDETAEVLGISPGAARVRLSRARQRLRDAVAASDDRHRDEEVSS